MRSKFFGKLILTVGLLFLFHSMRAQTASLSLSNVTSCPGSDITVSIHVENLVNAGAITLYIGYDTAVLEYDGHGNVHPQFLSIMSNAVVVPTTQVNIVWSSMIPGNIANGTLMDLYFNYKGGSSALTFNPGCDLTSVSLLPIPFTTENGSASIGPPYITDNPQNAIVTVGQNAVFSVTATGATSYQWQEFNGSEWYDLQNGANYQNVNTSQLTIVQAPLTFNEFWYRCFVDAADACEAMSDSAMLTVLPELTAMLIISSGAECQGEQISIPVQGYALNDIIEFGFYISYLPPMVTFSGLANINPVIEGTTATLFNLPIPHVVIAWSAVNGVSIPDGVLFELVFNVIQGSSPLIMMEQSFALNSNQLAYTITAINGQITSYPVPVITSQPANLTIYAGASANFNVQATGAERYQWYESRDNGATWIILQNQAPYSGVLTPSLTISSVPVSYDQFQYRCLVSSEHCDIFSQAAILTVDTPSSVQALKPSERNGLVIEKYRSDGSNIILTINAFSSGLLNIAVYDLTGKPIATLQSDLKIRGLQNIVFTVPFKPSPVLLVNCLLQDPNGKIHQHTTKVLVAN